MHVCICAYVHAQTSWSLAEMAGLLSFSKMEQRNDWKSATPFPSTNTMQTPYVNLKSVHEWGSYIQGYIAAFCKVHVHPKPTSV